MRKLVLFVAVFMLFIIPMAAAKSILYVSDQSCAHEACSCLTGEDKLFCDRLEDLGYNMTIVTEGDVKDSSSIWGTDSGATDMIFVGTVSNAIVIMNESQPSFCSNLDSANKKMFFTALNTYKSGQKQGCAFNLSYATFSFENNTCNSNNFWVNQTGYITKGYDSGDIVSAYIESLDMNVHSGYGWLGPHCTPSGGGTTNVYSAVSIDGLGAFWGLGTPSKFTNNTWDLFERTVLYFMGDSQWDTSYIKIPTYHTINDTFMVLATVKDRGIPVSTGTVSYFLDSNKYGLSYNGATERWENISAFATTADAFNITAEEGGTTGEFNSGTIDVEITSGNYQPGTYKIIAKPTVGKEIINGVVDYKMYDSDYEVKASGSLTRNGEQYEGTVDMSEWGTLTLEVNAKTTGNYGGTYKKLYTVSALKEGTDYAIKPGKWHVTSKKAGEAEQIFTFESYTANLTNIEITRTGAIREDMSLDLTGMPSDLSENKSLTFTATLDFSDYEEGDYEGTINFASDQLSIEIPVKLTIFNIQGDWLSISPTKWEVTLMEGKAKIGTFKLNNIGTWTATDFTVDVTSEIEGLFTYGDIFFIKPSEKADFSITAEGVKQGSFEGKVTITSVVGKAVIDVTIEVIEDLEGIVSDYENDLSDLEAKIGQLAEAGSDITEVSTSLSEITSNLASAKSDITAGRYSEAQATLSDIGKAVAKLKVDVENVPGPLPVTAIVITVVIIILGAGGYYGYKFWKGKKDTEEKKEEEEEGELGEDEGYRTEYY